MTAKHTEGPWAAKIQRRYGIHSIEGPKGNQVAEVTVVTALAEASGGYPIGTEEAVANANLIAAAPTMLEALELAVWEFGGDANHLEQCACTGCSLTNILKGIQEGL